jgi:hypothetical protein
MSYRSKKSSKLGNAKSKVAAKVLPKVLRVGTPKDVVPLVVMLRQKKKAGQDVAPLVKACMTIVGGK